METSHSKSALDAKDVKSTKDVPADSASKGDIRVSKEKNEQTEKKSENPEKTNQKSGTNHLENDMDKLIDNILPDKPGSNSHLKQETKEKTVGEHSNENKNEKNELSTSPHKNDKNPQKIPESEAKKKIDSNKSLTQNDKHNEKESPKNEAQKSTDALKQISTKKTNKPEKAAHKAEETQNFPSSIKERHNEMAKDPSFDSQHLFPNDDHSRRQNQEDFNPEDGSTFSIKNKNFTNNSPKRTDNSQKKISKDQNQKKKSGNVPENSLKQTKEKTEKLPPISTMIRKKDQFNLNGLPNLKMNYYDGLRDMNLQAHFCSEVKRKHLIRMGLITSEGHIIRNPEMYLKRKDLYIKTKQLVQNENLNRESNTAEKRPTNPYERHFSKERKGEKKLTSEQFGNLISKCEKDIRRE